ncbi:hypothetical protein N7474_001790 [Penicillium riverlandense]|uniref:uncharacterized protein n=1 Tax=Penicillium riverlandense TaxID=1903569 RepID=UPI0025493058|nr:uncharacterized protein N7474_001790 [Penicillium riverlandense]KAJ5833479.1 hypothetical protein N7474_001790 [Penicillium riverlandense]
MPIGESHRPFDGIGARKLSVDSASSGGDDELAKEPRASGAGIHIGPKSRDSAKPRGFWARRWKHFKRYWLCYGLLGVIFLAIFLPVFFLVILPAIAQRLVDNASIPIHSAEVIRPTPDTITFSLAATLDVPLGLSVEIDQFNLSLFNRDVKPMQPYVIVPLGPIRLKGNSAVDVSQQTTRILDEDQFTKFLSEAVYSKEFTLSAYGRTTAHLGKLKIPLKLDKDIKLNGLDKLSGFAINSARLALPAEDDGTNLLGSATIPNYSVVTFALGNVTLDLKVGDLVLGTGTINNVFLKPGNNTVPLLGALDISNAISHLGELLEAESSSLSEGQLLLSASGKSTIYDGLHIPYFQQVLNHLTVTANVPILKVLFGSIGQLVSSNPGVMQNVTSALDGLDLSSGPNMYSTKGHMRTT